MSVSSLSRTLAQSHLPALDGIRAISVLLVMAGHAGLASGAATGVNAFFVLSGFLITHLLLREYESRGSIGIGVFYSRRALRIFPAYYVFLLFSLSVDLYQGDARSREVALPAAMYYLNYYHAIKGHSDASIAHAWSLAVEEQFYLIWPLCLTLGLKRGRRVVAYGLVTAILAVCLWRSVGTLQLGLSHSWAYNALDCRFDSLAVGCLLAVLVRDGSFINMTSFVRSSRFAPLVTVLALSLPHIFPSTMWKYTLGPTVEALLVGVLILQLLIQAQSGPWSWLEWRPVRYLGTISYSAYLYHQWGLALGHDIARFIGGSEFLLGVGATVLLASGSYWVIERPFLALKSRLARAPVVARARSAV